MLICKNPECQKKVPEGMNYCDESCLRRHVELKQKSRKIDSTIEAVLAYIGVTPETVRKDAYEHWRRFIEFVKNNSPAYWRENLRPKLRSWIGVDFRYIDDYLSACLAWGIMELNNGVLHFKGIPEDQKQ